MCVQSGSRKRRRRKRPVTSFKTNQRREATRSTCTTKTGKYKSHLGDLSQTAGHQRQGETSQAPEDPALPWIEVVETLPNSNPRGPRCSPGTRGCSVSAAGNSFHFWTACCCCNSQVTAQT